MPGTIDGEVLEFGSGLPLVGASVQAGEVTTTTDDRGRFHLVLAPGNVDVVVTAADHVTATFLEEVVTERRFEVQYRLERYTWDEEMVVYGETREDVARTVISVEELRRVPGGFGDPLRALQSLPSVARGPELSGDIIVRGAEAQNTAAYVDGIKIPYMFHFFVGRSVVDPGQIQDIEFFPGAVPPRYGDVAQAVVNARTTFEPAEPGVHGRVHFDLLEAGVSLSANLGEHWTIRFGGRRSWISSVINTSIWGYRQVQGLNDPAYRPATFKVPYRDQMLRLIRHDGHHRFSFTLLGATDGIEYVPEWIDEDGDGKADKPEPPPLQPYDPNLIFESKFVRGQLRWDYQVPGHTSSSWVIVGRDAIQNLVPGLGLYGANGLEYQALDQGWFSVGNDSNHLLNEDIDVRFGGDVTVQPGAITAILELPGPEATTRATRVYAGPFVEVPWTIGQSRLAPGFRLSIHHLIGDVVVSPEPRMGFRTAVDPHWSFVAYAGLLSQGPTLLNAGTGPATGTLDVLRAVQSTVGFEARWPSGIGLDLNLYETEMWDQPVRGQRFVLDQEPPSATDTGETFTTPGSGSQELLTVIEYRSTRGRAFGLEAQLRMLPRRDQFGWISAAVGRSFRFDDSGRLRADADIPFNLVGVWGTGFGKGWQFSGRAQISAGLVFTPSVGVFDAENDFWGSYQGEENSDRYPLYKRIDVRVDKTWTARRARWTLYLDVYNSLNLRNPVFATYDWDFQHLRTQAWIPILPSLGVEIAY